MKVILCHKCEHKEKNLNPNGNQTLPSDNQPDAQSIEPTRNLGELRHFTIIAETFFCSFKFVHFLTQAL